MSSPGIRDRGSADALFARRPALAIAVTLILGIVCHRVLPSRPGVWISALLICSAVAARLFRQRLICSLGLLAAVFFTGVTAAQLEAFYFSPVDVAAFASDDAHLVQVELRVDRAPKIETPLDQPHPMPPKEIVVATVERIRTQSSAGVDGWTAACGAVILRLDTPNPRLAAGQRVMAIGRLQHPAPPMNPGQFDWAAYYREQRILAILTINHADGLEILEARGPSPLEKLRDAARRLLGSGFAPGQSHDHAALRALLLGDRDAEMRDVQDGFSRVGAAHLLAVSGLHVAIIAGFTYLLCRLLRVPPRATAWSLMSVVLFYGLIVLPATPALRAVALCLIFGSGLLQRRTGDRLQTLAVTCCAMLLYHPLDLYSAGFQLSFGTVFGLLVYAGPINRWMTAREDPHKKIARAFRPPPFWGRVALRCRRLLLDYCAFGLIAWLISAPLVAIHFNQINPWALLSGLVLFPLVVIGVIGGMAKLLLSLLLPGMAGAWATLALLPIKAIEHVIAGLERLPGSDIPLSTPPVWAVLLYYATLALPLLPVTLPAVKRCLRAAPAAACAMALGLPFLGAASSIPADADARITLLSVGAGQIAVVELPNGSAFLIDDGSSSITDPLRACLAPYLRSRGVRTIGVIYLSHPDYDHISAAGATAGDFAATRVVVSPVFREQSQGNAPAEAMLDRFDALHVPVVTLARGGRVDLAEGITLDALWPPPDRAIKSTNNAGLVLKLTCRGKSILFPADIQADTERELMRDPASIKADVLVAPHHGSAEITTADFLRAVDPSIIVSSNDRTLSHKQREFDKLAGDHPLYRTHRCGAITITITRGGELRVDTFLHAEPQRGPVAQKR